MQQNYSYESEVNDQFSIQMETQSSRNSKQDYNYMPQLLFKSTIRTKANLKKNDQDDVVDYENFGTSSDSSNQYNNKLKTLGRNQKVVTKNYQVDKKNLIQNQQIPQDMKGFLTRTNANKISQQKTYMCILQNSIFKVYNKENEQSYKLIINFNQTRTSTEMVNLKILKLVIYDNDNHIVKVFYFTNKLQIMAQWYQAIKQSISKSQPYLNSTFQSVLIKYPKFWKSQFISSKQFEEMADSLDIILFKTDTFAGSCQRLLTFSDYDHVALILKSFNDEIFLFESTSADVSSIRYLYHQGVGLWSWKSFIYHKWYNIYSKVAFRRLVFFRDQETLNLLQLFIQSTLGNKYQLSLQKLFTRNSVIKQSDKMANYEKRSYFCSELVAAALKNVNLLPSEKSCTQYWPSQIIQINILVESFTENLKLLQNAYYENEIIIEFGL